MSKPQWRVVGGDNQGGIRVREEQDVSSAQYNALLYQNSVVEEVEIVGNRMKYKLIKGSGPPDGWVTLKLKNKDLLVPLTHIPELIYFNGSGRGELIRLAFHAGGVEFTDTRVEANDWPPMKEDPNSAPGKCFKTVPVLVHGDHLLGDSVAIAQYAADLGLNVNRTPSPQQRSLDTILLGVRSDMLPDLYKCTPIGGLPEKVQEISKRNLGTTIKRLLEGVERLYPSPGPFLYALESEGPSLGDLVLFDIVTSDIFGLDLLGVDLTPYPKISSCAAACKRSSALPGLSAYLKERKF